MQPQSRESGKTVDSFAVAASKLDELMSKESLREEKGSPLPQTTVRTSSPSNQLADSVAALFMSASTQSDSQSTRPTTQPMTRPPNAPLLPTPPHGHLPHSHYHPPPGPGLWFYYNTPRNPHYPHPGEHLCMLPCLIQ